MKYTVKLLEDYDVDLCKRLREWCYDINGYCQEVHTELGPFLNEYMYQDALEIVLKDNKVEHTREYYFSVMFRGQRINHRHFADFLVKGKCIVECKAVEKLITEHRQQLWNYMRLTGMRIGILWNFAPSYDQSEHYYYDPETKRMYLF